MQRLTDWLDKKLLPLLVVFLLVFIPLYPKLPLIGVTHTWVYIRLEDIFVLLTVVVWFVVFLSKRTTLPKNITLPIIIYWGVGLLSTIIAVVFIFPKIANVFPAVAFLHYLRRIEYLILFFVAYSTIKRPEDLKKYVAAVCLAMFGVTAYGFGQRFLGLPAFLTMNEEFAKGIPLYLPPGARITSTFGGHYDFAAYLVLVIALLGSIFFATKKLFAKAFLLILCIGGLSVLLLTASRVSFTVYIVTISLMLVMQKKKLLIIPVVIFSFILLAQVKGTAERFAKTFRIQPIVINTQTGQPIAILENLPPELSGIKSAKPAQAPAQDSLPLGTGFIGLPPISDKAPEATSVAVIKKPVSSALKLATMSSEISTISGSFLIQKAFVYDISFTTRLQGGWPRAWNAFIRNPITGTGYSSISLASDNDYLRLLGETGISGFLSFLFIFSTFFIVMYRKIYMIKSSLGRSFAIGVTAGIIGLSLNAFLIDVFEASKVAYILWILMGITIGIVEFYDKKSIALWFETKKLLVSNAAVFIYLFLIAVFIYHKIFNYYFVASDFTYLKIAAQSKFSDIASYFTMSEGLYYRPLARLLYFVMYAVFWLKPFGYHFVSLFLYFICAFLVFLLGQKIFKNKFLGFLASCLFLFLPLNSESVLYISSYPTLLASLFMFLSFYLYLCYLDSEKKYLLVFTSVCFALALLSHEVSIVMVPVLIFYCLKFKGSRFVFSHKLFYLIQVLLVLSLIIIHFVSGAKFTSWMTYTQTSLPVYSLIVAIVLVLLIKKITRKFFNKKNYQLLSTLIVSAILIFWFQKDLANLEADWEKASKISRQIIYAVKDNYRFFPKNTQLYFVNIPDKYRQAYIFPSGLEDAVWFVYRDESIKVKKTASLSEALRLTEHLKSYHIFNFDNGELKEIVLK